MKRKCRVGDMVKLHPNKKHSLGDIGRLGYNKGYVVLESHSLSGELYHTIKLNLGIFWNIYDSDLMRIVE